MTAALLSLADNETEAARERRCIVTGEVRPDAQLIRFVASPDACVVPDLAGKLPGRGYWVTADRAILDLAVAKNHFSRAAKVALRAPSDLSRLVEEQLARRISEYLGLARRSGQLVCGFDQVAESFGSRSVPAALVEASDGAADGRQKLARMAASRGLLLPTIDCLNSAELSLALGRENVVHAALKSGRLSERVRLEAGRLRGFRPASGHAGL